MKHLLYLTRQLHEYAGAILYINLFGMVIVSLLEGLGILLLVPMLSMSGIVEVGAGTVPSMFNRIFHFHSRSAGLVSVLLIFVFITIAQSLLQYNLSLREVRIHTGFINHVRFQTYRALMQAKWEFFLRKRKSDLINSLTEELGRVTGGVYMFMQFIASAVFTLIQIGIAFWLSPQVTGSVLVCGIALAFFSRRYIRKSKYVGNEALEMTKSYLAGITDQFNGIKDIKSNMLEQSRYEWLVDYSNKVVRERIDIAKVRSQSQISYKITLSLLIGVFIYFAFSFFHAPIEQVILIILIFSRLWPRFTGLQSSMENIAATIPAFKALLELQRDSRLARELEDNPPHSGHVEPIRLKEGIECKHIHFRYNREHNACLQDISLYIPANSMSAIVGRSGAGKSTCIDLIMGLLKPDSGQVLIDGEPLSDINLLNYRRSISYVPQDPFLFNGSIKENLLLVMPEAGEKEMWEALEFSSAAEFVRKLPQGLDTQIGDRGIRLSGGERQRLVLARAILKRPSILVLDEATSALDSENERKIQKAIERMKGTMTIIVIAHRMSTIRNADQVIVLDEGRIAQVGEYVQLAKDKKALFSHLLAGQAERSI